MEKISYKYFKEYKEIEALKRKFLSPLKAKGVFNFLKAVFLLVLSILNMITTRLKLRKCSQILQNIKIRVVYDFYGKKIVCYNINNLHFVVSPWEEHEFNIIEKFGKEGVYVDAGAYIGTHSIIMASKADKVYAFEANPENAKVLRENIKINNLEDKIEAVEKAVSSKKGIVKFKFSKGGDGTGKISKDGVEVESISIDDVVKGKVGLIKIDVEGHEIEVLKGSRKALKNFPPLIFEALNEKEFKNTADLLEKQGYNKFYKLNQFSYLALKED